MLKVEVTNLFVEKQLIPFGGLKRLEFSGELPAFDSNRRKTTNPLRGIETLLRQAEDLGRITVEKQLIPFGGLKPYFEGVLPPRFASPCGKITNPLRGIETRF